MRLIDAEELLEHAYREKLDTREAIVNMINSAPPIDTYEDEVRELKNIISHLERRNENMKGQIKALVFVVRCNGVSGDELRYD